MLLDLFIYITFTFGRRFYNKWFTLHSSYTFKSWESINAHYCRSQKKGDFIKVPLQRPLLLMQKFCYLHPITCFHILHFQRQRCEKQQLVQLLRTPFLPYIARNSTGRRSQYSRKEFAAGLFSNPQHNTTQMKPLKPLCWKRSIQISAYQSD